MNNLLFDIEEITTHHRDAQVRAPSGRFTTKAVKGEFDKMRSTIVMLIRQRQSVYRQLRAKDEEIIRLKQKINESN